MHFSRREFLQLTASGIATALPNHSLSVGNSHPDASARRFHFVQIDVFSSQRLQGNPLAVFPDARGLSGTEMQNIARETNLQETTFVLPRDPASEREQGIKVRIFTPEEEIPFGGHPTLGTAMVLRNRLANRNASRAEISSVKEISLDLQGGKIPVAFRDDAQGEVFGEMHQVEPVFGPTHDRATVAALHSLRPADISDEWPIQSISTGLPFVIVPLKTLATLQSLRPDHARIAAYFEQAPRLTSFYYVTRDTQDPAVGLRSRAIFPNGEDPATGSAAGCTAAWMVRYLIARPGQTIHIRQGVEIRRPSELFVRADKRGDQVANVRVGGHAVEVMEGDFSL